MVAALRETRRGNQQVDFRFAPRIFVIRAEAHQVTHSGDNRLGLPTVVKVWPKSLDQPLHLSQNAR